jgi:hypothetical protein
MCVAAVAFKKKVYDANATVQRWVATRPAICVALKLG